MVHPSQFHSKDEGEREEDGEAPDDDDVQHGAGHPRRGVHASSAPRAAPRAAASPAHLPPAARGRVYDHFVPGKAKSALSKMFNFKLLQFLRSPSKCRLPTPDS